MIMKIFLNKLVLTIFILAFCLGLLPALAANTGKITGLVRDKNTGEPLVGANVVIEGLNLGASTDLDGYYFILQVPPGEYTIVASYVGYHNLTIKQVEVRVDLTTKINFDLTSELIESETIEVVAEKVMVQHDITSTRRSISGDEINGTPGIENVSDIMAMQAGIVMDTEVQSIDLGEGLQLETRDPSLVGLNIRGSSGGDALILIDGVPASHPVYGGFDIMDLNKEEIESIEIITGAFSAEYGQTQSGIINITTKSGSRKVHGNFEYRSDEIGIWGESFDKQRLAFNLSGPLFKKGQVLGLNVPGEFNYFVTYTLDRTNTENNNHRTRGDLLEIPFGDNDLVFLKERQDNEGKFNLRLDHKLSNKFKSTLSYRSSWKKYSRFSWAWKDYPDHTSEYKRNSLMANWAINHTLSNSSFYKLNFGYTYLDYQNSLNGKNPRDFWVVTEDTVYSSIQYPQRDPQTGFYNDRGYETPWSVEENEVYRLQFDFTSQIHKYHLLKFGFTYDYKDLYNLTISSGGLALSPYGHYLYLKEDEVPEPRGPYKAFGLRRWVVEGNPMSGGFYLTDKFEIESLIINAGLRLDWFRPGDPTTDKAWKNQWEEATGLESDWPTIHYQLDPRLGVSFPISTETTIYFSYGHFNKAPGVDNYIRDPYSGGFVGNPHLDFEKTVKFEFGTTHQLRHDLAIDIKSYTNETAGSIGSTTLAAKYGNVYLHDNTGYSRARGLEFELRKQTSNYLGGRLTYSIQWAKGYSSSAFDDYRRSLDNFPNPIRERRLNWDVRHSVVFQGNISVRPDQHPKIFGIKIPDNWNITWLSRFNTGRPYTPGTLDRAEEERLYNTDTGPTFSRTDLKIEKGFKYKQINFVLGFDVDNLFNQYNVNVYNGFNRWTGEPYEYGDTKEAQGNPYLQYDYYEMYRLLTPRRFGVGRHVELFVEVKW